MKVDKHGLNIIGLRKAASSTRKWLKPPRKHNRYYGGCAQLYYNKLTGEVWVNYEIIYRGTFECSMYTEPEIIMCCVLWEQHTMQELADIIDRKLTRFC